MKRPSVSILGAALSHVESGLGWLLVVVGLGVAWSIDRVYGFLGWLSDEDEGERWEAR